MTSTAHLVPEQDAIQAVRQVHNWSENLLLAAHDGAAETSVWAHWSRVPARPHLWEAVLTVYLPGGELLVHRSFGAASDPQAASSGPLSFRCVQPLQTWALHFDGMCRRTTSAEVAAGPLVDGPWEPVVVEVRFDGVSPTWSAHDMGDQEWADGHLEQPGRVTGSVTVAGKCIRLATYGFRDHSYGPRDYARIIGDTWLTGVFPSGRNFLALEVWTDAPNVPLFVVGFVDDGRTRYPVTGLRLPRLSSRDGAPGRFSAEITTTSGTALIEVVQTHCMNYTFDSPVGMTLGTRDAPGDILATEGPARLRWDGEEAHGWVEKTLRFGEIGSSEISKL